MVRSTVQKWVKLPYKKNNGIKTWKKKTDNLESLSFLSKEEIKKKKRQSLMHVSSYLFSFTQFLHKSFKTPLSRSNPSAEMLLLLCDLGISILGGGSGEKHTTTTVRLSQLLRCSASLTKA